MPCRRTRRTWSPAMMTTPIGSRTMCHISIWPKFSTLKTAPAPVELMPSLAWVEIHWESKFCCDR